MTEEKDKPRSIVLGQNALTVLPANSQEPVELAEGFVVTPNGMRVAGKPPFNRWEKVGRMLCATERGIQFALGDYLNSLEAEYGDSYYQIVDYAAGWSESTCSVYRWLATRIPYQRRRMDKLGIRHHLLVAPLSPQRQDFWLGKAADSEDSPWTVSRLKKAIDDGSDGAVTAWWVLVAASSAEDQLALQNQLEQMGRQCKAVERRTRSVKQTQEKKDAD